MNSTNSARTEHIEYFQRYNLEPGDVSTRETRGTTLAKHRSMVRIKGIGRLRPREPGKLLQQLPGDMDQYYLPADLITSLALYPIPLAYLVCGTPGGVRVHFGSWSHGSEAGGQLEIINTALQALHPALDLAPPEFSLDHLTHAGLVLGVPTFKPTQPGDYTLPWDRVIRALAGGRWAVVILAQPIQESVGIQQRNELINELRTISASQASERAYSPLTDYYNELLRIHLRHITQGLATGLWRTAVYLLGDTATYYRLAAIWCGIFTGEQSKQEPIRVWVQPAALQWASTWTLPAVDPIAGPGHFQHLFSHQTLLTSEQVAAYVHLPTLETTGFQIKMIPEFDVVPPDTGKSKAFAIGNVIRGVQDTKIPYSLTVKALQRHTLIAGITGSGKTNTIFHILRQLWQHDVPFLVIEPAKTEYRALVADKSIQSHLRIFTLGEERVSPFRLNPFEIEPGVSVATHIDLLKSVFNASFGMWTPLPQVLERCLHEVYADFGWDPVRQQNHRLPAGADKTAHVAAFPTLSDLYEKVGEVVDKLGYEEKVESDIKAALMTRLNSLRIGGKGIMLDTKQSLPVSELLAKPAVIELEQIGDDDEKAFVMGLLFIRLYEYLQTYGTNEGSALKHLVVIEEAHRLLANVPPSGDAEQANVKGKAVETFAHMLSEVRAYGESFLIAEQIPNKLAPDVIKNTNVKIVHRMVSGDDREVLRLTMNMNEQQSSLLATLHRGQAAVFTEGDDRPILVQVPRAKEEVPDQMRRKEDSDKVVAAHMQPFFQQPAVHNSYLPFEFYPQAKAEWLRYNDDAKALIGQPDFQNQFAAYVLSMVVDGAILPERTGQFIRFVQANIHQHAASALAIRVLLLHSVNWYVTTFGRYYNWPYDVITQMQKTLAPIIVDAVCQVVSPQSNNGSELRSKVQAFQQLYHQACRRHYDPFSACTAVCPAGDCLFRYHNKRLLRDKRLVDLFDGALAQAGQKVRWDDVQAVQTIGEQLLGDGSQTIAWRQAGLCFGVQRINSHPDLLETKRSLVVNTLIKGVNQRTISELEESK